MSDAVIYEIRARGRRHFGRARSDRREPMAELAAPPGSRSREQAGAGSFPQAAPEPIRAGLARWMLDAIVISFAYGGCLHNIHPHYVDVLRELSRQNRR